MARASDSHKSRGRATARRRAAKDTSDQSFSVYDGTKHLGDLRGSKQGGFSARSLKGRKLGQFSTVKEAADCLSSHAAAGAR